MMVVGWRESVGFSIALVPPRGGTEGGRCNAKSGTCVIGTGYSGPRWNGLFFAAGPPPAEPGFELPLVFAMQKPAAHEPSADAIAAAAALKPPQQRDERGTAAARAPAAPPLKAAAQGTKRKHEETDEETDEEDDEEVDAAYEIAASADARLADDMEHR